MRITAKQLAEKAGVSQATVSLVLRGKPGVSESVRIQILQLAREMGLEPQFRAAPTPNGKTIQLGTGRCEVPRPDRCPAA